MISIKPKSGIVKFTNQGGFEENGNFHKWNNITTLNFNTNSYNFLRTESFGGKIAKDKGVKPNVLITTKSKTKKIEVALDSIQDEAYEIIKKLRSDFIEEGKTSLGFDSWKHFKSFETKVNELGFILKTTNLRGHIDGWDVFILPKYNIVVEIYYHWENSKNVRKLVTCELKSV